MDREADSKFSSKIENKSQLRPDLTKSYWTVKGKGLGALILEDMFDSITIGRSKYIVASERC